MDHQHPSFAHRSSYVTPYPHGGSKVTDLCEFAPLLCVPVRVDVYTRVCVYSHMFDSADLTRANECCRRG